MRHNKFCTAAAAVALAAMTAVPAFAAQGWELKDNGDWIYRNNDGSLVTDAWRESYGKMFYLGSNGIMVRSSLIEDGNRLSYVNSAGARVENQWRYLKDADGNMRWYYFAGYGKADKAPDDNRVRLYGINGKYYAFDDDGRMLYGWADADYADLMDEDDEDAWKSAEYYFGAPEDGAASIGWRQITVEDDGEEKDYWFYFGENGRKNLKANMTINGVRYSFDTEDGHMLTGWTDATAATSSDAQKYIRDDGSAAKNSWVWAVPAEDYIPEDYEDDTYSWFYTNNAGRIYTDCIKKINGKRYAFDLYGRMLTDFVTADENGTNVSLFGLDEDTSVKELMDARLPIVYYCSNTQRDGAIKTGNQTISLDDGERKFYFNSNGIGTTGYISKIGKFTVSGMILNADEDYGDYAGVTVKAGTMELADRIGILYGKDIRTDGTCVLVNKSGAVQKNRNNLKSDDLYYCTDSQGHVTYVGTTKR